MESAGISFWVSVGGNLYNAHATGTGTGWRHIVGTYDGTQIKIYEAGTLAATYNSPDGAADAASSVALLLGANPANAGTTLNGKLDEVRIYSRVLSSTEAVTLTSTVPAGIAYDANGNMTVGNGQTLAWDVENHLTSVANSGGSTLETYTYDGDGARVSKVSGGHTIVYVNQFYKKDLTANTATSYYYLGGALVATKDGSTLRYVHRTAWGAAPWRPTAAGAV